MKQEKLIMSENDFVELYRENLNEFPKDVIITQIGFFEKDLSEPNSEEKKEIHKMLTDRLNLIEQMEAEVMEDNTHKGGLVLVAAAVFAALILLALYLI